MADRRTLESAAQAVAEKLDAAKVEYEQAVDAFELAKASMLIGRERVSSLLEMYELVKPKPRGRKAAKVA